MNKKLLIIACSKRKSLFAKRLRAFDLYDGVIYRVIKKFPKRVLDNYDVVIISAKYGLINPNDIIETYDLKMTNKIAAFMKEEVSKKIEKLFDRSYKKIIVCLGKTYLSSIEDTFLKDQRVFIVPGGIGSKMKNLKKILNDD